MNIVVLIYRLLLSLAAISHGLTFSFRSTVSIRDILSWVNFINTTAAVDSGSDEIMEVDSSGPDPLDPATAYIHGACMVFLDALGSGKAITDIEAKCDVICV